MSKILVRSSIHSADSSVNKKYGESRSGTNKITVITGLPGSGKSHLIKTKILPNLDKKGKSVIVIDPNLEYKPRGNVSVFRIKDYHNAASEVETMLTYFLESGKKPNVIICDECNVVFDKLTLLPVTKRLVNTLRHEHIDLILSARRPVDVNITMSELARERFVFKATGVNDIKRLNEIISDLGNKANALEGHDYLHIINDTDVKLVRAK